MDFNNELSCPCGDSDNNFSNTAGCMENGGADNGGAGSFGIKGGIPAAVYVAIEDFDEIYDLDTAFQRGTLFHDLDKPFYGYREDGKNG